MSDAHATRPIVQSNSEHMAGIHLLQLLRHRVNACQTWRSFVESDGNGTGFFGNFFDRLSASHHSSRRAIRGRPLSLLRIKCSRAIQSLQDSFNLSSLRCIHIPVAENPEAQHT